MSGVPAIGKPAPGGLRGLLQSVLKVPLAGFRDSAPACAPAAQGVGVWPHVLRVLVVDDDPVNLMLVASQLEVRGVSPWLASDGAEAVTLACETHFDLILMDLQMPYLDGLQATAAIRRFEARQGLAPVFVLAYSSKILDPHELRAAGLDGRLSKPCPARELDECLSRWCPVSGPGADAHPSASASASVSVSVSAPASAPSTRAQSGVSLR